ELSIPVVAFHSHERAARFIDPKKDVPVLRISSRGDYLQLPATARAHGFIAKHASILPVEKFQSEVFIGHNRAANLLAQFLRRKFSRAGIGHKIEARSVFAEA